MDSQPLLEFPDKPVTRFSTGLHPVRGLHGGSQNSCVLGLPHAAELRHEGAKFVQAVKDQRVADTCQHLGPRSTSTTSSFPRLAGYCRLPLSIVFPHASVRPDVRPRSRVPTGRGWGGTFDSLRRFSSESASVLEPSALMACASEPPATGRST